MKHKNSFLAGCFVFLLLTFFIGIGRASAEGDDLTLSGVVRNGLGDGVNGVNVTLLGSENSQTYVSVATPVDGAFSVSAPQGSYTLVLTNGNTDPSMATWYEIRMPGFILNEDTVKDLTIPSKPVALKVLDLNESPVIAHVEISPFLEGMSYFSLYEGSPSATINEAGWCSTAVSDNDGVAHLMFFQGVNVRVRVTPMDNHQYISEEFRIDFLNNSDKEVTLDRGYSFSGVLKDGNGNPIVGGFVRTSISSNSMVYNSNFTGEDGVFTVWQPAGNYSLSISAINQALPFVGVTMEGLEINSDLVQDLTLPYKTVNFSVTSIENDPVSSQITAHGTKENSLPFSLYLNSPLATIDPSGWTSNAESGIDGVVSFQFFPSNDVRISLTPIDNQLNAIEFDRDILDDTPQSVCVDEMITLSGVVKDGAGNPLPGMTVSLTQLGNQQAYTSIVTESDGEYQIFAPYGNHVLHLFDGNMGEGESPIPNEIYADIHTYANTVVDIVVPTKVLNVTVVDSDNIPVSQALVRLEQNCGTQNSFSLFDGAPSYFAGNGWEQHAVTDSSGNVSLSFIPGCIELEAESPISTLADFEAYYNFSGNDSSIITLGPAYLYSGIVKNGSGVPVAGAMVSLIGDDNLFISEPTSSDGSYALYVPMGYYSLRLQIAEPIPGIAPSFTGQSVVFEISGDSTQDLVIPTKVLTLSVVDSAENPIPGAVSVLSAAGGNSPFSLYDNGPQIDLSQITWFDREIANSSGGMELMCVSPNDVELNVLPMNGFYGLMMSMRLSDDVSQVVELQME